MRNEISEKDIVVLDNLEMESAHASNG